MSPFKKSLKMQEKSVECRVPDPLLENMKITGDMAGLQYVLQGTFDSYETCGNGAREIHVVF